MKKIIYKILTLFFFIIPFTLHSYSSSTLELLPSGHWVYDAMFFLNGECKKTSFVTNAPMSVQELKVYFDLIDYTKLSPSGKEVYSKLDDFFSKRSFAFQMKDANFAFNMILSPEFMYKSNENIDWSYSTDYTGHLNSVNRYKLTDSAKVLETDWSVTKYESLSTTSQYMASTNFMSNPYCAPSLSIPLYLSWGDKVCIGTSIDVASSIFGMSKKDSFTNIPLGSSDMDFLWPRDAFCNIGKSFGSWGLSLVTGRQGLQIGHTLTGSVIYNSTFETNSYMQFNVYGQRMRYNLDVVEVSSNKYLYLHSIEARPLFNWFKFGITEATLLQNPFEIRYINPLMIMHSYGSWEEYMTEEEEVIYGEAHVGQYMGIQVELTPLRNFRLYCLYSQNETQSASELSSANGRAMPDSFAWQLGFDINAPSKRGGWYKTSLEGVYTTPFMYIKQGADWSFYSKRSNMQSDSSVPICSWMGTPFGPDALGFQSQVTYKDIGKHSWSLGYLFLAHGTNSFGLFGNTVTINGNKYYAYYPSVLRRMGLLTDDESENIARTYRLTGTVQFTNTLQGDISLDLSSHITVNARGQYTVIINNKNKSGKIAHGSELSLLFTYKLF